MCTRVLRMGGEVGNKASQGGTNKGKSRGGGGGE